MDFKAKRTYKYSLQSSQQAFKKKSLLVWTHGYLNSEGKNQKLSQHIHEMSIKKLTLCEYSLQSVTRCAGPEKGMLFYEDYETWNLRVQKLQQPDILKQIPPLLISDYWGKLTVIDGAHRHEALKRENYEFYWMIFIITKEENVTLLADYNK